MKGEELKKRLDDWWTSELGPQGSVTFDMAGSSGRNITVKVGAFMNKSYASFGVPRIFACPIEAMWTADEGHHWWPCQLKVWG